ncbi:MAG: 4Fe-4S dicluster domain-containing protein [Ignavibacteriae bacterium]|nr:4Fe-4S dicluster domain-containing protein [Ignavibacteriota bacterium]
MFWGDDSGLLRPPGATSEEHFLATCTRCMRCIEVCPYKSIRLGSIWDGLSMGSPVIRARSTPCYLCMKCPEVCPSGSLMSLAKNDVQMGLAKVNEKLCLAFNGILCRTCYNACPIFDEALVMDDELHPKVVTEKCVGCGVCEYVCPTEEPAIVVGTEDVSRKR